MENTKVLFFKPKPTAGSSLASIQLVVLIIESNKDVGPASGLGKKLGFKDMRSANDDLILSILNVNSKSDVTLESLNPNHSTNVMLVWSDSIQSTHHLESLENSGMKIQKINFHFTGTDPKPTQSNLVTPASTSTPRVSSNNTVTPTDKGSLGITAKKESATFGDWYQDGCYILKPASYRIWEFIQSKITGWFDERIKALGVENAYFPMFVSSRVLEREKDHIEGFAPEVAWVTRAGKSELEEHIAIRPTSETVMYPYYAKWIQSYRDLPLKINQWNSVVRWEFKNPQPFIRTREFLWQEGHTAHLTKPEADTEVREILDLYRGVYEELLAVPVTPGIKSEKEKFAGGLYTTTVEGFIPTSGRGIQAATSHCLGQNFSKMFNISVEDPARPVDSKIGSQAEKLFVWQNSWGLSTRTIGVMVMVHGDDKGLVLPPRVAQLQVIVIPVGIVASTTQEEELAVRLRKVGVRAKSDLREGYTPGWKFNSWEMKGIPLRLELGPKDLANQTTLVVRRDTGIKTPFELKSLDEEIPKLLETVQNEMYGRAKVVYDEHRRIMTKWDGFVPALNENCSCVIPWCEEESCEDRIKDQSAKESAVEQDERAPSAGAKSLCIPFDQSPYPKLEIGVTKCIGFGCEKDAKAWAIFGRSY
ncbi:prolyl-tRNA synthetase [Melampsora americana]|nr:prolyl-tRNA synthetase [Melampsora americana]